MANGIGVFSQTEAYPDKLQSNEQDVFAASGFVSSHWSSLHGGTEESELYGGGGKLWRGPFLEVFHLLTWKF